MKYFLLVSSVVFAFGCKKGGLDGKLDDLSKLKDKMCACTDKACADKVHDDYIAWKKGNSKDEKPSEAQEKRYREIHDGMMECRHKFEAAEAPAAPAAPAPTEAPKTP